ncbi:hypothetical protein [Arthrobacter sp.]|nr:hypothetical protein [Arthrobacter sp.]
MTERAVHSAGFFLHLAPGQVFALGYAAVFTLWLVQAALALRDA